MRPDLLAAMADRVLVADGAMGTMLQAAEPSLADFQGYEGCNEILNVTRPDVVAGVHDAYLAVGVDAVETNTFGANLANLGEYGIAERIGELAEAGARIAREAADRWTARTPERPRWVLGSVGPGTKLPTLGHVPYATLRDAYQQQAEGLLAGGADAVLVETVQDLLQAKAALNGARRAMRALGVTVPLIAQVTVEATGTLLLGSETAAALTALEPLGVDVLGLNCATGPAEMSEHLRTLARLAGASTRLSCMPNAGLPILGPRGAEYPLSPVELADAHERFVGEFGLGLVGGCCGTTPEHLARVVERVGGRPTAPREAVPEPSVASLYSAVPLHQDTAYLAIGERTNANGSRAFRDAMLGADWERCLEIAREQTRDGSHLLDLCVDYVGRDGALDMAELAGRLSTASTLPLVLDSTEPEVIRAGLERLGGRAVVNSVNFEDGDGPGSRFARVMPLVAEHGAAVVALCIDEEGQARTAEWKVRVADRLLTELTGRWGLRPADVLVDCLTFPIATGQEETRRDAIETIEAIREITARWPGVGTTLGISNVSFGLNPAARQVLNSVFLHECLRAGLTSAIVHPSRILPWARIPEEQREAALDLVHDRRRYAADGGVEHDPLAHFLDLFADAAAVHGGRDRAAELAALPLDDRLKQRIIDGDRNGLEADLTEALAGRPAMSIINDVLLDGMRTVGDLFGRGEMQLPFVLQSAEVMKLAVAWLEPHLERSEAAGAAGKGTIVLATVKGDVHDIGKNLVDIILSNNGYRVVNIGIKQPVAAILEAAAEHDADVIGMSGLLVKSTVIMRDNLAEMNVRGVATRWPVILGGAALTRAFVEQDLAEIYEGEVRYARDAFEGLRLMDALVAWRRGEPGAELPPLRGRRVATPATGADAGAGTGSAAPRRTARPGSAGPADVTRSDVAVLDEVPTPPFWGERVVRGIRLSDYLAYLDERATFVGQWGLKPERGGGRSYAELVETEGRPRLRGWLDRVRTDGLLEAAVVHGWYPAVGEGNDLVVLTEPRPDAPERVRFTFPRQQRDRRLCLADFVLPRDVALARGTVDVVGFQIVTMGSRVSEETARLFAAGAFREYLELHGLSVQLTEALAEMWHARGRADLGLAGADDPDVTRLITKQGYRGSRYSFGYPACPDLEDQRHLVDLLDPARIGVTLSEEFQLHPEQSTSALVLHHPEAKYFNAI